MYPVLSLLSYFFCIFSESQTIESFGKALHLSQADIDHLRNVFIAVENGDIGHLKSLGIKDSEIGDVKFFLDKLVNTGFLDWQMHPKRTYYDPYFDHFFLNNPGPLGNYYYVRRK